MGCECKTVSWRQADKADRGQFTAGLRGPSAQADNECTVYPIYLSSQGLVPGEGPNNTNGGRMHGCAALHSTTTGLRRLEHRPEQDDKFKDRRGKIINKQSQALCEKKYLYAGTIKSHYAVLSSSSPNSGADSRHMIVLILSGGDFQRICEFADRRHALTPCLSDARCKAYSFDKWNRVCFLKDHVGPLLLEPVRSPECGPRNTS